MTRKLSTNPRLSFILPALLLLLLTACGTFEIGVEPAAGTPEPGVGATATEAVASPEATAVVSREATAVVSREAIEEPTIVVKATNTPGSEGDESAIESTPEPTATLQPEADVLKVAYVKDANVWLWSEGGEPVALTKNGGVESVFLSDDGRYVAFTRGGNIWLVQSDGSGERQLTTDDDFASMSLGEDWDPVIIAFAPYRVAWRPESHTLFFNTAPQLTGPGLKLSDDLWAIDVDEGTRTNLLSAGEGGQFHFAPDGRQLALVTPGDISLYDVDSQERIEVFTYSPVVTFSEFQFYAQPSWSADGRALYVAIPPVDRLASTDQLTAVWSLPVDGTSARLMGQVPATTHLPAQTLFAPDLGSIAYLVGDTLGGPPAFSIAIAQIGEFEVEQATTIPGEAEMLDSWSPGGRHLVYTPPFGGEISRRIIVDMDGNSHEVGEEALTVFQVSWIDETRYLYLQHDGVRGWALFLAEVGVTEATLIDGVVGSPPSFDVDA